MNCFGSRKKNSYTVNGEADDGARKESRVKGKKNSAETDSNPAGQDGEVLIQEADKNLKNEEELNNKSIEKQSEDMPSKKDKGNEKKKEKKDKAEKKDKKNKKKGSQEELEKKEKTEDTKKDKKQNKEDKDKNVKKGKEKKGQKKGSDNEELGLQTEKEQVATVVATSCATTSDSVEKTEPSDIINDATETKSEPTAGELENLGLKTETPEVETALQDLEIEIREATESLETNFENVDDAQPCVRKDDDANDELQNAEEMLPHTSETIHRNSLQDGDDSGAEESTNQPTIEVNQRISSASEVAQDLEQDPFDE